MTEIEKKQKEWEDIISLFRLKRIKEETDIIIPIHNAEFTSQAVIP